MHVVSVRTNFQKLDFVAQLNFQARFLQHRLYLTIEHNPSVLRRKHQVIQQHRNVVILVKVLATHLPRIPPQGAGNLPKAIQKAVFAIIPEGSSADAATPGSWVSRCFRRASSICKI